MAFQSDNFKTNIVASHLGLTLLRHNCHLAHATVSGKPLCVILIMIIMMTMMMMRRRRKIMVIKCSGGRVDINQPEDNRACFDHLLRTIYRTGCTWYKSCRKWKWMKKEIMIETMQQCSLADFTLEASSVVNTAGGSNRFAFNVHSTFATLIHVRLRGLVDDEWDTLWDYYWEWKLFWRWPCCCHHVILFAEDLVPQGVVSASYHFLAHRAVLLGLLV